MFNIFKKKSKEPPFNIHHPDVSQNIEFAFEAGPAFNKRKFYRVVNDYRLPVGRHKFVSARLQEAELRMTLETLMKYIDNIENAINGGIGKIDLGKVHMNLYAMRSRAKLGFDTKTIERLAAVVYFDETEDLRDFDEDYGDKKIEFWKKYSSYDFFLTRPISELLGMNNLSEESLKSCLMELVEAQEVIKDLTSEQEKSSSENT
jgi:hypothetical protein